MPSKCYICTYSDPKRSLFRIPDRNDVYSDRSGLWLKLLEEKSENANKIRICSEHFVTKKPAKSGDCLNIDWVPNKNLGKFTKNRKTVDYHLRKMKKDPPIYLSRLKISDPIELPSNSKNMRNEVSTCINDDLVSKKCNDNVAPKEYNDDSAPKEYNDDSAPKKYNDYSAPKNNDDVVSKNNNDNEASQNINDLYSTNDIETTRDVSNYQLPINQLIPLHPLKKRKFNIIDQQFFLSQEIQTEMTSEDVDMLFQYYKEAVEERNMLLLRISTLVIDYQYFEGNDKRTRFYTGLTTWSLLKNLFEMVESALPTHFNCKLTKFQMLALTLMKLRLNLLFTDLGYRFQIEVSTASRYFHRCIYILFKLFKNSKLIHWPTNRENLLLNTPSYFRSTFKELITIIVDCFELFIETPSVLLAAAQGFSQYKHNITLKYLIGISITGVIIFVSIGYGGRASDKKVTIDSGFLDKLEEGDFVLADKGFLIEDEVQARDASLKIPCFVRNGNQLDPHDIEKSRHYSSIRIHVERLISVVRQKFNICSDEAQMSAVSKQNDLFHNDLYDKIIFVCCCLVNVCPSVVNTAFEI